MVNTRGVIPGITLIGRTRDGAKVTNINARARGTTPLPVLGANFVVARARVDGVTCDCWKDLGAKAVMVSALVPGVVV